MPPKANDQVITDRHDAMSLARLMRSRDLTPVDVPAVDAEAIRAMRRARDDTLRALQAAQPTAQSLLAVARSALSRVGQLASSPPPLASCGGRSHPGAAEGLPGRRPAHHRTDGTAATSGTRTARAGDHRALPARRRGAPSPARCPVHGCGDHGRCTRRSDALQHPLTAEECFGADAVRIVEWGTASVGQHDQDRECPGAACPG